MNADPHRLRRDLEQAKRIAPGLNDETSTKAVSRYLEEITTALRRMSTDG